MGHFLFQRNQLSVIFSQTVPEDLPQFSTDITHDKHLLHRRNGTDGFQRVIQKMGIDLELQIFQLCLFIFQFLNIAGLDQLIEFAKHPVKLLIQHCNLIGSTDFFAH